MKNTITISIGEYKELVAKAERMSVLERMARNNEYICTSDVINVLGIERVKEADNETL